MESIFAVMTYRREYDDELSMAFGNGGDRGKGNVPEEDYCDSMSRHGLESWGQSTIIGWLIEKATNSAYSSSNGGRRIVKNLNKSPSCVNRIVRG